MMNDMDIVLQNFSGIINASFGVGIGVGFFLGLALSCAISWVLDRFFIWIDRRKETCKKVECDDVD